VLEAAHARWQLAHELSERLGPIWELPVGARIPLIERILDEQGVLQETLAKVNNPALEMRSGLFEAEHTRKGDGPQDPPPFHGTPTRQPGS
jgi:hypothetical protein